MEKNHCAGAKISLPGEMLPETVSQQEHEGRARVTGRAVYGIDLVLPGMIHGKIVRSTMAHARIKRIDTSAAEALPGVLAVLTGADLCCKPFGITVQDELPLAAKKVRYIGDEIACVAAVDQGTAEQAVRAVKVEYEELPAVFSPTEALAPGAPLLHESFPGNVAWQREVERGDSEAAFRRADLVVESVFSVPVLYPAYLEPIACVAVGDGQGGLLLHTALQSPDSVRVILARVLDMPLSRVHIVGPAMGGGFGGRVYGNLKLYILSALMALKTGRPVKMKLTRKEEFTAGRPLIAAEMRMKMALTGDGTFLAREADIITDNGAYSAQAPWVSKTLSERNDSVYRIPAVKTRVRLIYTNKVPTGQYRAYGNQLSNFATESLIDMAAGKLDIDRLKLRLQNCTRQGDVTVHGLQIGSCALDRCLQKAAKEIGWDHKKKNRGYGLSAAVHANGSLVFDRNFRGASALARLELDGRVTIFTGEQDYGQGTHGTFARIASRVLGLPPEKVAIVSKNTVFTPHSLGALAMRQTTLGGRAVQLAAESLERKILKNASQMAGEPSAFKNGLSGELAAGRIDLVEIASNYHARTCGLNLVGEGAFVPGDVDYDDSGYGNISLTYSFAAHAAEVEIDADTGAVNVHKIVAVHDSGRILNPLSALGQVCGGVAQGLSMSCYEGGLFEQGRVLNASFSEYMLPLALDMPDVEVFFIEKDDPAGPYGARGLGEIVMVPVPGALANALADALDVPVRELPATAEKVYSLLQQGPGMQHSK